MTTPIPAEAICTCGHPAGAHARRFNLVTLCGRCVEQLRFAAAWREALRSVR